MMKILAVLVNYGDEQLNYLQQVVSQLKSFKKYQVHVIVNSNISLEIDDIDEVNIFQLDDYQLLPLTCRKIIWKNRTNYDVFIYGENDHLFLEKHIDKHLEYEKILPKNRISGLIQYEKENDEYYYPAYHANFDWDNNSLEVYEEKKFAHFTNIHQASFILTQKQLIRVGEKIKFNELASDNDSWLMTKYKNFMSKIFNKKYSIRNEYSVKCKVNTDVFRYGGMKKVICISDFNDNLIHHLPNLYIHGDKGRNKLRSSDKKMKAAINELLK